jgi:hypothetical protein
MKTPVRGVVVLASAFLAHCECRHRRERAIVWHVTHDGEARPTIGAVVERVAETPIAGSEDFTHAVNASSDVRRNEHPPIARGRTFDYAKSARSADCDRVAGNILETRQWRRFGADSLDEV